MLAAAKTATKIRGKPQIKSTIKLMMLSTAPLTYPAISPIAVPAMTAITVTEIATIKLMRIPTTARAAMSRPRASEPRRNPDVFGGK